MEEEELVCGRIEDLLLLWELARVACGELQVALKAMTLMLGNKAHTSPLLKAHTSPHTSYLIPHTSYLSPLTSHPFSSPLLCSPIPVNHMRHSQLTTKRGARELHSQLGTVRYLHEVKLSPPARPRPHRMRPQSIYTFLCRDRWVSP